jgi:hypothetical protein
MPVTVIPFRPPLAPISSEPRMSVGARCSTLLDMLDALESTTMPASPCPLTVHDRSVLGPADVDDARLATLSPTRSGSPGRAAVLVRTWSPTTSDHHRWPVPGHCGATPMQRRASFFVRSCSRGAATRRSGSCRRRCGKPALPRCLRAEPRVYLSDLADRLPPGLTMPRAYAVADLDTSPLRSGSRTFRLSPHAGIAPRSPGPRTCSAASRRARGSGRWPRSPTPGAPAAYLRRGPVAPQSSPRCTTTTLAPPRRGPRVRRHAAPRSRRRRRHAGPRWSPSSRPCPRHRPRRRLHPQPARRRGPPGAGADRLRVLGPGAARVRPGPAGHGRGPVANVPARRCPATNRSASPRTRGSAGGGL